MQGRHVNFTGVAFRENGFRWLPKRLMSVGIRTAGSACMSGWEGDGVHCKCLAVTAREGLVTYWRFEEGGVDAHTVYNLIQVSNPSSLCNRYQMSDTDRVVRAGCEPKKWGHVHSGHSDAECVGVWKPGHDFERQ